MIIWFILILATLQVAVGQEVPVPQRPQIIRTSPVAVPCFQCLQNPGMNLGSLMRPSASGCGCGCGGGYEVEDPRTAELGADDEECCCCGVDNSQNNEGGPSFSVAMLAPLASVLTSFMSGLSSSGNQALSFDFDGQTCNIPSENPPVHPQCDIATCNAIASNQSQCNIPLATPFPNNDVTARHNSEPPQMGRVTHQHALVGPHCFRKPKKGVSDIEEDSLYAFAPKRPKKINYNPKTDKEAALNLAFPHSRFSPDVSENQQVQIFRNDQIQQSFQRDNNLIHPQPSGNPNFDTISRLALSSSHHSQPHFQSNNHEQSLIPMV